MFAHSLMSGTAARALGSRIGRRRFLRLSALGGGLLATGSLLVGCRRGAEATPTIAPAGEQPTPTAAPAAGGTFVIARLTDTITLDFSRQYELTSPIVVGACYERLVTIQPSDIKTIVPQLAREWEISEDVTTYTLHAP